MENFLRFLIESTASALAFGLSWVLLSLVGLIGGGLWVYITHEDAPFRNVFHQACAKVFGYWRTDRKDSEGCWKYQKGGDKFDYDQFHCSGALLAAGLFFYLWVAVVIGLMIWRLPMLGISVVLFVVIVRIARATYGLKKKLVEHMKDTNAHKES